MKKLLIGLMILGTMNSWAMSESEWHTLRSQARDAAEKLYEVESAKVLGSLSKVSTIVDEATFNEDQKRNIKCLSAEINLATYSNLALKIELSQNDLISRGKVVRFIENSCH